MVPDWIKNFDTLEDSTEQLIYITRNVEECFSEFDRDTFDDETGSTLLSILENVASDLAEIATICKRPSILDRSMRMDILEPHVKIYHVRIVMEMQGFVYASAGKKGKKDSSTSLNHETLLNLLQWIER